MYYIKIHNAPTMIEFHNNWLGEEIVIVNGQIVSKQFSFFGTQHYFSTLEDNESANYILIRNTFIINGNLSIY